jgi:DnaK suppressor protein
MATKTKVAKAPPAPAPEKKGAAKAKKPAAPPQVSPPVEVSKSAKSSSKAKPKPKPKPQAKAPAPAVKTIPVPVEKPVKKTSAKVDTVVVQAAPQPSAVAAQDQKWQEIRMILEKLKEDTLREIRKSVKNGTEAVAAIEPGGDIYDQASSERDRELGLLLGDREREKIHSIDEALLRIDEGEYGICEECDEDIPLGRLKAMPFTRHCVKCKSDLEKLQAQTKRVEEERAYREIPLGSEEEE